MYWPLAQSARIKQELKENPLLGRMAVASLYLIAIMPFLLIMKRWMAEVLCVWLCLMFLYRCWTLKQWDWLKAPPIRIMLALWLYTLLIVTPLAMDPMASLARAASWWRFILMFAAIVYWLCDYQEEIKRVAIWILLILSVVAIDTYIQYFTGTSLLTGNEKNGARLTGPLSKLVVGIYLAKLSFPGLGILLYHAWQKMCVRHILACYALMTFILVAITFSGERTALITFIIGLAAIGILLFVFLKNLRIYVVGATIVQTLLLYLIFTTQTAVQERVADSQIVINNFDRSPYYQLWNVSYKIWEEHPITGVGLMNFREACPKWIANGTVNYCDLHSHNVYLEWLSETGIIGFIGICAFVISLMFFILHSIRRSSPERYILVSFALAGLAPTFFPLAVSQSFFSNWPALLAWYSIALAAGTVKSARHER